MPKKWKPPSAAACAEWADREIARLAEEQDIYIPAAKLSRRETFRSKAEQRARREPLPEDGIVR